MSATAEPVRSLSGSIRAGLAVSGIVSAVIGILILVWPGHTAVVVTAMIAAYAVIGGLIYIALGVFASALTGWARTGHVILGAIFVIGGILAFTRLGATTAALFVFVGVLVGILWIVEGVTALITLGNARFKVPTLLFALLSMFVGILLLFSPLYSVVLWLWLGIALLVLGVLQLVRAITWNRRATRRTADA